MNQITALLHPEIPFGELLLEINKPAFGKILDLKLPENEKAVLENLAAISKYAFDQEFSSFGNGYLPFFEFNQLFNPDLVASSEILNRFKAHFLSGGCRSFSEKYPQIKPLQQSVLDQYERYIREIKAHIKADSEILAQTFNNGHEIGTIEEISINQGDLHQNGKSTAIIRFGSDLKLVYKPRPGALDLAFNMFMAEIGAETGLEFKTAVISDRETYFWMEFIEHSQVNRKAELTDYYTRCGALLAVIFLLGGTDFHFENIIANGAFPVLIDLECLFGATEEMQDRSYSVYNTGLLPLYAYTGNKSNPIDNSGFGASGKQESGMELWKWQNPGSDAMRLEKAFGFFTAEKNQPIFGNEIISPAAYLTEIVHGFKKVSYWFLHNKEAFSSPAFSFNNFKNTAIRVIVRPTMDYKFMLENSFTTPALVSEEARAGILNASLHDYRLNTAVEPETKSALFAHESEALKKMNVPFFTANTSGKKLYESGNMVTESFFNTSPFDFTLNRILQFNPEKLAHQVKLIESAFAVRYPQTPATQNKNTRHSDNPEFNPADFQLVADQIAENLRNTAIKLDKTYLWNTYTATDNNKFIFSHTGNLLFDGNSGIAFFLELQKAFSPHKIESGIPEAILNHIAENSIDSLKKEDIFFSTGVAGHIYALLKTNDKATNSNVIHAEKLFGLITLDAIKQDKTYDVMAGSAGLILSLAHLYKVNGSEQALKIMTAAAAHLLENRVTDPESGFLTWQPEKFSRPLTGFSHGASGIACALLTLYDCTKNEAYKDAFYEALSFENFHKNPEQSNWFDLRNNAKTEKVAWCHGAAGIGLSRLHAYKILHDQALLPDIEMAIAATRKAILCHTDYYCCGNSGRIDFLIEAATVLNRPELLNEARQALAEVLTIKNNRGFFQTYDSMEISLEDPSLFRGTSGIGYTILRSMYPDKIPCLGLIG